MTRSEIVAEYGPLSDAGTIQTPGKFEGGPPIAVHYYDVMMNGCEDETFSDGAAVFYVTDEDRAAFPEIEETPAFILWLDMQGFVYIHATTRANVEKMLHDDADGADTDTGEDID